MEKEIYTIILVDDEQEIKDRLRTKIPLSSGFRVIGEASNGYDAIELVERLKPHVVLTDIRMPFVDGIELATILKKVYPKAKVAFISGYDEFAYAKEAINLDVVSYLSKPLSDSDVADFLVRLKSILDAEKAHVFNRDVLNAVYQEHLPVFIENQFQALLQFSEVTETSIDRFKAYHIDLSVGVFTVGMIEFQQTEDFLEMENLRIFLINLVKRMFEEYGHVYTFNSTHGLVFITQQLDHRMIDFEKSLYNIILLKKEFTKLKVRIGLSETFDDFKDFIDHVHQARHALTYSTYLNIGSIIHYKDVCNQDSRNFYIGKESLDQFSYALRFGTMEDVDQLLQEHKKMARKYGVGVPLNKEHYLVNITQIILDFASNLNLNAQDILGDDFLSRLRSINNLDELMQTIYRVIQEMKSYATTVIKSSAEAMLEQAVAYLDQNYHDSNISMEHVCDDLGISVSYISTLFRKLMNTTFNRYLVQIRMEKAKELLRMGTDKVYEIALAVGYNDVYYFSHSFKKETGQTPKEFRHDT